jgi:hypothetical protein
MTEDEDEAFLKFSMFLWTTLEKENYKYFEISAAFR